MRFISWNVNGFRACLKKGFEDFFYASKADFFSLQEIKMLREQSDFNPEGYYRFWNSAEKKGYSGTAVFAVREPVSCAYGIGNEIHDAEGRTITLEYDNFFLVNEYVPNSRRELERLDFRMKFEDEMREYLTDLDRKKPVIYCGDLNVAHEEIDLKNPSANRGNAGFTDGEREKMTRLLNSGFSDTFRVLYPEKIAYSWWSYMFRARENNAGWRIDYFIVSDRIMDRVKKSEIYTEITGSDHCPIGIEIDI